MWIAVGIIVGLIAVFLIYVAIKPGDFRIARSAVFAAPSEKVFPLINDFHNWPNWSPWAKLDPEMQTTFEGPASGVGSVYTWSGNKKVGSGKMTILESDPTRRILIQLEFMAPWVAKNLAEFTLTPQDNQTRLDWAMTGTHNYMGKLFGTICNLDKMVGKDFEKGLVNMKVLAES